MDVTGIWRIAEVMKFGDDMERMWVSVEEFLANDIREGEDDSFYRCELEFCNDGKLRTIMAIPEDATQEEIYNAPVISSISNGAAKAFATFIVNRWS